MHIRYNPPVYWQIKYPSEALYFLLLYPNQSTKWYFITARTLTCESNVQSYTDTKHIANGHGKASQLNINNEEVCTLVCKFLWRVDSQLHEFCRVDTIPMIKLYTKLKKVSMWYSENSSDIIQIVCLWKD